MDLGPIHFWGNLMLGVELWKFPLLGLGLFLEGTRRVILWALFPSSMVEWFVKYKIYWHQYYVLLNACCPCPSKTDQFLMLWWSSQYSLGCGFDFVYLDIGIAKFNNGVVPRVRWNHDLSSSKEAKYAHAWCCPKQGEVVLHTRSPELLEFFLGLEGLLESLDVLSPRTLCESLRLCIVTVAYQQFWRRRDPSWSEYTISWPSKFLLCYWKDTRNEGKLQITIRYTPLWERGSSSRSCKCAG